MRKTILFSLLFAAALQVNAQDKTVTISTNTSGNENFQTFVVPEGVDVNEYLKEMGVDLPNIDFPDVGEQTRIIKKEILSSNDEQANKGMLGILLETTVTKTETDEQVTEEVSALLVSGLIDGGGAKDAGLQKMDQIKSVNGVSVETSEELFAALEGVEIGEQVEIVLDREAIEMTFAVELRSGNALALDMSEGWQEEIEIEHEMIMKQNADGTEREVEVYIVDDADIKKFMDGDDLEVEMEVDESGKTVKKMIIHRETVGKDGDCPDFKVLILEIDHLELEKITKEDPEELAKMGQIEVEEFSIAPNPNSGNFNLSFSINEKEPTQVRVLDMSGQEVYMEDLGEFVGAYNKDIRLQERAAKGVYIVQVLRPTSMMSKKLIIN